MIEEKGEVLNENSIPADNEAKTELTGGESSENIADKKNKKRDDKASKAEIVRLEAALREANKQLDEMKKEHDALNERYLRMMAEYDNYRKRVTKERQSLSNDIAADVIADILPIYDDLERASAFSDAEKVAEGLALICKSFSDTLAKLGVTEIEALGCSFDPNIHNAVLHIEDEAYGENVVVDVLQKGYMKGEKVIRYAMVKVAN
ncbi:MAG: nucleotide exchange factor GrpE [Clostridiales bacterium]|nr:nucleotide exchange factor GrpE [Clostridiales bacterium]